MRVQDRSFAGLLVIEGLDQATVRTAFEQLVRAVPSVDVGGRVPIYGYLFSLDRRQLP